MEYVSSNYSNAYRLPTHQMKTSNDNTLLSKNNPARSITSRSSRAHDDAGVRRHGVEEARSHLTDNDGSRYSRTLTTTTKRSGKDIAPVPREATSETTPAEVKPQAFKRNVEAEFLESRKAAEYKYRADDQLFATNVEFSPGKNRVADNEVVADEYFSKPEDPANRANLANYAYGKYRFVDGPYGKAWNNTNICDDCENANHRLADQKAVEADVVKQQEHNEEVKYLNNLAEIEERKGREEDMRREYRKQIDEYHLSLQKPEENKVEKAQRLREKIRLEAEEVDMQRNHDEQVRRQRQNIYKNELGGQVNGVANAKHNEEENNANLEANHRGLNIGNKNAVKPNMMQELNAQIAEKNEIRQELDGFRGPQNTPNDFLQYKDRFDDHNLQIVLENRRLMVHPDNSLAKEKLRDVHENEMRKATVSNQEKLKDYEQMNAQIAHEKRILQEEYLRRAGKGVDLRNGLLNQMHDKTDKVVGQVSENREFRNDFSIGGIKSFGITNIDIRPQLADKAERKHREVVEERNQDRNLMAQLDEYDRNKVNVEVERKKAFGQMLNSSLNQQIAVTEEKKNRKINAIKKKAANCPAKPAPCTHHRCTLCTKVMD